MVRANGQRDGVGKTSQLSGAFEHTGAILDPTRVSPYRPAADEVPHSMRPDTRQRLTARTNHPKDRCAVRPSLRSEPSTSRTVNRGCQAATRLLHFVAALRVTAAADRAESPCGPAERLALVQREQARDLGAPLRCRGQPLRQPRGTDVQNAEPQKKGLQSGRRPHTTVAGRDSHPLRNGALSRRTEWCRYPGIHQHRRQGDARLASRGARGGARTQNRQGRPA